MKRILSVIVAISFIPAALLLAAAEWLLEQVTDDR